MADLNQHISSYKYGKVQKLYYFYENEEYMQYVVSNWNFRSLLAVYLIRFSYKGSGYSDV